MLSADVHVCALQGGGTKTPALRQLEGEPKAVFPGQWERASHATFAPGQSGHDLSPGKAGSGLWRTHLVG